MPRTGTKKASPSRAVKPESAVAYVERANGRILCVWNRRYGGWAMPGGKVEPHEHPESAVFRELEEETGLLGYASALIHQGKPRHLRVARGSFVHVYRVGGVGTPRQQEPSSPVTWLTREEFLRWSPFAAFYKLLFAKMPPLSQAPKKVRDHFLWRTKW